MCKKQEWDNALGPQKDQPLHIHKKPKHINYMVGWIWEFFFGVAKTIMSEKLLNENKDDSCSFVPHKCANCPR